MTKKNRMANLSQLNVEQLKALLGKSGTIRSKHVRAELSKRFKVIRALSP